jgi:hypothetical protein
MFQLLELALNKTVIIINGEQGRIRNDVVMVYFGYYPSIYLERFHITKFKSIQGCIQKFLHWPPDARTANDTALCH